MDIISTWEEASKVLDALCFDLGESPSRIKEGLDNDYYLEYNKDINHYVWKFNNL